MKNDPIFDCQGLKWKHPNDAYGRQSSKMPFTEKWNAFILTESTYIVSTGISNALHNVMYLKNYYSNNRIDGAVASWPNYLHNLTGWLTICRLEGSLAA